MIQFRQHIPAFVDTDMPPVLADVETTAELLALPSVQRWAGDEKFSHFAMSDGYLMAIFDEGRNWWVLGYVNGPVDLPTWDRGLYRAKLPDGSIVDLPGSLVASSVGDELRLHDGTSANWIRSEI